MAVTLDDDLETLGLDDLADVIAAHERFTARIALAAARLERDGSWVFDGSVSMKAWMRHHCRLSDRDAGRWLAQGRFLSKFDAVADAAVTGALSAGQVRAIQMAVTAPTEPILDQTQVELVATLIEHDVRETERRCIDWRHKAEAIADMPEPPAPKRDLSYATAADGAVVGRFDLDDPIGAEFTTAIDLALTWNPHDEFRLPAARRAEALFDICAFFNANHTGDGTPRHRPHVELTMSIDDLHDDCRATTSDGAPVRPANAEAFLCDSVVHRVIRAGSTVLDYGRSTRTVPVALFRAVAVRDGGCRYPGCDRKIAWCEAHHIHHWRHGGHTTLDNLVLLCGRHHHLIHKPGWQVKLLPDATLEITSRDGLTRISRPPGASSG